MKNIINKIFKFSVVGVLVADVVFGFFWPIGFYYCGVLLAVFSSLSLLLGLARLCEPKVVEFQEKRKAKAEEKARIQAEEESIAKAKQEGARIKVSEVLEMVMQRAKAQRDSVGSDLEEAEADEKLKSAQGMISWVLVAVKSTEEDIENLAKIDSLDVTAQKKIISDSMKDLEEANAVLENAKSELDFNAKLRVAQTAKELVNRVYRDATNAFLDIFEEFPKYETQTSEVEKVESVVEKEAEKADAGEVEVAPQTKAIEDMIAKADADAMEVKKASEDARVKAEIAERAKEAKETMAKARENAKAKKNEATCSLIMEAAERNDMDAIRSIVEISDEDDELLDEVKALLNRKK